VFDSASQEGDEATSLDAGDQQDLIAARLGDHAAFGRIYDRHAPVVLSICRRYADSGIRDGGGAEDALQETFLRAYRLLSTLQEPARLRSWLFGIARRVCSERRRQTARRLHHEGVAMTLGGPDGSGGQRAPHRLDQCGSAERAESLRRLERALEALPDEERLAIHLFYLDHDPVHAARECLDLSRSGFYKLLGRARARLSRLMLAGSTP
jgi:RNA polymerase sigma-70 factor (ECF subfamily)